MQHIIIAYVMGFMSSTLIGAFVVYFAYKRIQDLERFLFLDKNPQNYAIMNSEHKSIENEYDPIKELEKEYRKIIMGNTVDNDDIKRFGERAVV